MTISDYLSKEQFPLTSREGCSLKDQAFKDALAWDNFQDLIRPLTSDEQAYLAELNRKIPAHKEVMAEYRQLQKREREQKAAEMRSRELTPA